MPKIVMMKGLPASGKSTKAKELLEKDGNAIRVNRDLLRIMLHFDKWTPKNERMTKILQEAIVIRALKEGKNVIIDDTNLAQHEEWWNRIALGNNARLEVVEMPLLPLSELIERDKAREKSVGRDVIYRMAMQYGYWKPDRKHIICDIDGTIADCSHRREFVKQEPKDWKGFFANMDKDGFRKEVWEQAKAHGLPIIIVSARPEQYRETTLKWLEEQGISESEFVTLIMRQGFDKRPDTEVKLDILNMIGRDNIKVVYDDRPSVIRMWRENGVEVIDVGNGEEF